jgi:flavin-dependent dehydrogenase
MKSWIALIACLAVGLVGAVDGAEVLESARGIPVACDVDVVVVGGSTGAVAAAARAAKDGAKVFLAAPRHYLGDDMCATYRLWLEPGEVPGSELAKKIFAASTPTPMHVKRSLDDALLDAGVEFLYGCYVTDVLRDGEGNLSGIVMANRAGRQAVRAKVIIDATDRGIAARTAGAKFKPYPSGKQLFKRIVFGGKPGKLGARARKIPSGYKSGGKGDYYYEYSLNIAMKDASPGSFADADQTARGLTWHDGQVGGSESLHQIPPDPMAARKSVSGDWPGAGKVDLDAFRPVGIDRIYVLGGCADISRKSADKLLRPVALMAMGERIGRAAALEAKGISTVAKFADIKVTGPKAVSPVSGEVREVLRGVRSTKQNLPLAGSEARGLPVLGKYDVVVIGGGTGGAPAGIAAARQGAKTLVVEVLHGLGGVGTLGMIAKYYHGNRVGFSAEIDRGVGKGAWNVEKKMEWYRSQLVKAGADIWYGSLGCGAIVENNRVKGVVVATHQGRGVILARVVIDSTGNASMAAAAGARSIAINADHISVQGTGLPPLEPGAGYTNTDWTFHDDDDVLDMWRMFVVAKSKYKNAFDLGQLIDTRARRRIVGDIVIMPMDIQNRRTFPDTVVIAKSNFDNHGFSSHTIFMIKAPDRKQMVANVPYRCMLPKGFDGILVTGLGMSAHGDAMPVLRMQPDIQNQGYAAGVAGAMVAKTGSSTRDVDIKALQKHLVAKGNVPQSVLTDKDSYPMSAEKIASAVKSVGSGYEGIAVILAQPGKAIKPLVAAYESAKPGRQKVVYAHILGMLGEPAGASTLASAVKAGKWDKGWNFRGMGQYGRTTSPMDNLIIALGRTGQNCGVEPILEKVRQLTPRSEFSHYRAVAMALETLRDTRAAGALADLLKTKGISGHAFVEIRDVRQRTPASRTDTSTRNSSLRELILARALYRCGDRDGIGEKILRQYTRDLRGHYSRHAAAVLRENPPGTRK